MLTTAILVSGLATIGAAVALWWTLRLARELRQVKRESYYLDNRLKRTSEEIQQAVRPLRFQLAGLVDGRVVSPELILHGRLYHEVSAAQARDFLDQQGPDRPVVIDVRTPKEYAIRRIPGARLVPFEELERRYQAEIPASALRVLVCCQGGDRSRLTCEFLGLRGYTNLYHLTDGMQNWHGATEGEGEVRFIRFERKR